MIATKYPPSKNNVSEIDENWKLESGITNEKKLPKNSSIFLVFFVSCYEQNIVRFLILKH